MRACMASAALAALTLVSGGACADDAVARGEAVVEQWCRQCHLRAEDAPDPVMAPPYEELVTREGRDRAWFSTFLREDHFPMTTYRLFDHEKDDVVAWLLDLQERQREKRD